jgi:hypothetical protein
LSQDAEMVAVTSTRSIPAFYAPNATARVVKSDSDASPTASATPDDPADQQNDLDAIKTLDKARQNLSARRKQDALDKLERARKELELLRTLGGSEKSIAWKARELAQRIGKAAVEYGDAARVSRRSGDSTAPDQQADASAPDASATSPDRDPAIKLDAAAPNDASSGTSKPSTQTGTADNTSASSVKTDADAVKAFADAEVALKRVFEELVLKGKIKHTSSHEWIEAERARAEMGQEIQDLSNQIESGQNIAATPNGAEADTSPSISVNILA